MAQSGSIAKSQMAPKAPWSKKTLAPGTFYIRLARVGLCLCCYRHIYSLKIGFNVCRAAKTAGASPIILRHASAKLGLISEKNGMRCFKEDKKPWRLLSFRLSRARVSFPSFFGLFRKQDVCCSARVLARLPVFGVLASRGEQTFCLGFLPTFLMGRFVRLLAGRCALGRFTCNVVSSGFWITIVLPATASA